MKNHRKADYALRWFAFNFFKFRYNRKLLNLSAYLFSTYFIFVLVQTLELGFAEGI